jgi:hypothetical protein
MVEAREVFEMTAKQIEPDREAWRDQERRQRRANRRRKIGAFAVAGSVSALALVAILGPGATSPPDEQPADPTEATSEEVVAARFAMTFYALDADHAITYLADDADISGLVGSLGGEVTEGTEEGLRLFISWLEAARYEQFLSKPCVETSGAIVRCPFGFQLLGSQEIGREPYGGSYLDVTVRGGEVVEAALSWATGEFSPQMWEPFASWVSAAHPDDAAVMYADGTYRGANLTEQSVGLWRQRVGEYVNEIVSTDPISVGRNTRVVEGVEFSFTVPDTGWERFGTTSINKSIVGPQGAEAIIFWTTFPDGDDTRPDDANPCENLLDTPPGPTAADLAAAVSTAPGIQLITGPSDVTVGGLPAKYVSLEVREDAGCDPGYFFTWQAMWWGAHWPETGVDDTIRVWIVDVGGTRLFFEAITTEDADDGLFREIEPIIESIRFG